MRASGSGLGGMLALSLVVHLVLLGAIFLLPKVRHKRMVRLPTYMVDLVELPAPRVEVKEAGAEPVKPAPVKKPPVKPPKPKPKPQPKKEKAVEPPKPSPPKKVAAKTEENIPKKEVREEPKKPEQPQPKEVTEPEAVKEPVRPEKAEEKEAPAAPPSPPPAITAKREGDREATASGPVTVDKADFPYAYYLIVIRNRIGENWNPSLDAYLDKAPEKVIVSFDVLKDGKIVNIALDQSSGTTYLDRSAIMAVQLSDPLPPLPLGFRDDRLRVHFAFEFEAEG